MCREGVAGPPTCSRKGTSAAWPQAPPTAQSQAQDRRGPPHAAWARLTVPIPGRVHWEKKPEPETPVRWRQEIKARPVAPTLISIGTISSSISTCLPAWEFNGLIIPTKKDRGEGTLSPPMGDQWYVGKAPGWT